MDIKMKKLLLLIVVLLLYVLTFHLGSLSTLDELLKGNEHCIEHKHFGKRCFKLIETVYEPKGVKHG